MPLLNTNNQGNTLFSQNNSFNSQSQSSNSANIFNSNPNTNTFKPPEQQQQQASTMFPAGHAATVFGSGNRFMATNTTPNQQPQQSQGFNPNQMHFGGGNTGGFKSFATVGNNQGNIFGQGGQGNQGGQNSWLNTNTNQQTNPFGSNQQQPQQNSWLNNQQQQQTNMFSNTSNTNSWLGNQGNQQMWGQQQNTNTGGNIFGGSNPTFNMGGIGVPNNPAPPGINPNLMQPRK